MTRRLFTTILSTIGLCSALVPALALADGNLTIKNATIDSSVMVEVRQGASSADSVPAGTVPLKKGESVQFDSTNLQYFWRREANPGSNDGKWTDWERVDPRSGNQKVEF